MSKTTLTSSKTQDPRSFDVESIRQDFPILSQTVNGHPLVYLDNAATSQKPRSVLDAITGYYEGYNSNIHRGLHHLSEKATTAYEDARSKVKGFINAASEKEINFTKGTTEAVNLVAQSYGRKFVNEGERGACWCSRSLSRAREIWTG